MSNFEYFTQNYDALFQQYGHKFLAIKDCSVIGVYNSLHEAITETAKTEELGTFLVQECTGNKEHLVNHFQGNLSFKPAKAL